MQMIEDDGAAGFVQAEQLIDLDPIVAIHIVRCLDLVGGVDDGHLIADLGGPRFQAFTQASPAELARSPMHNPFGRLKLVSMQDMAETN